MHPGNQNGKAARLPSGNQYDNLQGNRYGGDRADVRLSFRSRGGWPHDYSWIRLRRREKGHDQAAQFAPGKLLPDPSDDGPEVPKNRGMDESVYVFWNAGLF